jgi:hypothetical protein
MDQILGITIKTGGRRKASEPKETTMTITIRYWDHLLNYIENQVGHSATNYLIERLAGEIWREAQEAVYRLGNDWSEFLADVDLLQRASNVIASDIQGTAENTSE